jgi:hypothetical protein
MSREIVKFCPKSPNFIQEQGISRELAGNFGNLTDPA